MTAIEDELNFDEAVNYHYGEFPPADINYQNLAPYISSATAALGRYDGLMSSLQNSEILLAPLRRQEAVVSSRMEGTITTLDELLEFEAANIDEENMSTHVYRSEVMEVHAYAVALRQAQMAVSDGLPICGRLVKDTHRTLLRWGRGAKTQPGIYKTEQNYLVDRMQRLVQFIPVSPNTLEAGMRIWEEYANDDSHEPLTQAAVAHVEFESLHPFKDGNGRVGRMLITLMLWQRGLIHQPHFYISGALERRRDAYIEHMRNVSKNNDWTTWTQFFLEAIREQAIAYVDIAQSINSLYNNMKDIFRDALHSQWGGAALDYVFTNPVFLNSQFKQQSGIPSATAGRFTPILLDRELIREVRPPSGSRSGVYSFEPLMRLIRI